MMTLAGGRLTFAKNSRKNSTLEPPSQSHRRAGAADAQGLQRDAAVRRVALGPTGLGTDKGRLLRRNRAGEAPGRDARA